MNDFKTDLTGVSVVVKKIGFYRDNANTKTRTFICEGGPGCTMEMTGRKIQGRWESDKMPDTIDSYSIETVPGVERPPEPGGIEEHAAIVREVSAAPKKVLCRRKR